ncbi:hypothetical protein [Yinghuangia soli]|uniref:Uncharacterized protein n=1 Tax=Yinghuangia soli TaxID=2908204 RepID=A0AA41Q453_9ACTN|nr:hypothetical protein [Yinghuangia soli]MCF2530645.1 hypothetical protein [Yinghuangia soli]
MGLRLDVAGEQDAYAGHLGQQDQAGVVRRGSGLAAGCGGVARADDLPVQRAAESPAFADLGDRHRHSGGGRPAAHSLDLAGGLGQPGGLDQPHRTAAQHAGQPLDVIGMEMAQHDHGHT